KPSWKRKNAVWNALLPSKPNDELPRRPPPVSTPNIRPNPKSQNSDAATRKLANVLIATLIEFFDRTRPLSSAVKPACMKKTRAAQPSSQAISTGSTTGTGSPEPTQIGHPQVDLRATRHFPPRQTRQHVAPGMKTRGHLPSRRRDHRERSSASAADP